MSGRGGVTRAELAALVRTAATRGGDGRHVLAQLGNRSAGDRTVPAARAWLRGWGPSRITAPGSSCACETGRCPACN